MEHLKLSLLNASTLELHYWFIDKSHSMNAVVQNKCEYEFLAIVKEVAAVFDSEMVIETEPFEDGGLRRIFKLVSKSEKKSATITTAIITALVTGILITPITTTITKATEKVIEHFFEDKELKDLEKEKLKEEIKNLKTDTEIKRQQLNQSHVLVKRRSNFFETLEDYPKVNQISIVIEDGVKNRISGEHFIERKNFKNYIVVSDVLEPKEINDIEIEIISPVLKKGNFKWRGLYNGEIISFNMKSSEFKTLVQTGQVEFKNGSSINCLLEIESKINNEAVVQITNYNILRVNKYFEHDRPIETSEGKQYRQKQDADKMQTKLIFKNDEDSKQQEKRNSK